MKTSSVGITMFVLMLICHGEVRSQCACNNCPLVITDAGPPGEATLEVSGAVDDQLEGAQRICKVSVNLNHDVIKEVELVLVAPDGSSVELMSSVNGGMGDLTTWNIDFLPCGDTAFPDAGFSDVWDGDQAWVSGVTYSGSYYPSVGCLEDLTGSINGTWKLQFDDIIIDEDGELLDWSITFADADGITCQADNGCLEDCVPEGGSIPFEDGTYEENDPALNFPWVPFYNSPDEEANPINYGYTYVVFEVSDGELVQIGPNPDLSTLPPGVYSICGLSYALVDEVSLPVPDGTYTDADLDVQLLVGSICGDLSNNCNTITIEGCEADAGEIIPPDPMIVDCVDGEELVIDINPIYDDEEDMPPSGYSYTYAVQDDNGIIVLFTPIPSLVGLPAGFYTVCGFSYLDTDFSSIPAPNNSYTIVDLQDDIDNDVICGDISDVCFIVEIIDVPLLATLTGPDVICSDQDTFYVIGDTNPTENGLSIFISTPITGYSQFTPNLAQDTVFVTWTEGPGEICILEINECGEQETCIQVEVIPNPEFEIVGDLEVCLGDTVTYLMGEPIGPDDEYVITSVDEGTILSQEGNEVTIAWNTFSFDNTGEICGFIDADCDSEEICIEVELIDAPFPFVSVPFSGCVGANGTVTAFEFQEDPSAIFDYEWTVTGATIVSETEQSIGLSFEEAGEAEVCLTVNSVCGLLGPECYTIFIYEVPEPMLLDAGPFCPGTYELEAIPSDPLSFISWSSNPFGILDGFFGTTVNATFDSEGDYTITVFESVGACFGQSTITVEVIELQTTEPTYECTDTGTYIVTFEILDGDPPYTVNGVEIVGNTYVSDPIPSGTPYNFVISTPDGCTGIIEGVHECPCITDAGTMEGDPIELCISDVSVFTATGAGDEVLDGNDIGTYVLHLGSGSTLGSVIATSSTGDFTYDPATMIVGVTYYISFTVGNNVNGTPDQQDPCFDVAEGIPITFFSDPFVAAGQDDQTCGLGYNLSNNSPTNNGTWQFVSSTIGGNATLNPIPGNTTVSVDIPGDYIFSLTVDNGPCEASDSVQITFLGTPEIDAFSTNCNGDNYTITFTIVGGSAPYSINGAVISGDSFTSDPIPSGDFYSFIITDSDGCEALTNPGGTVLCDCITDAGTMDNDLLQICLDSNNTAAVATHNADETYDPNDIGEYILHTSQFNILGTVLDINGTGIFEYDPSYILGQIYYMSFIVGTENDGIVDLSDECLSVSVGQPVVWLEGPMVDAGDYLPSCDPEVELQATAGSFAGLWTLVDSPEGSTATIDDEISPSAILSTDLVGLYTVVWSTSQAVCAASDTAVIEKTASPSLSALATCTDDGEAYTVVFDVAGDSAPYLIDGVEVSFPFTSDTIAIGEGYDVTVTDSLGCSSTLSGSFVCQCGTLPGVTSTDTFSLCSSDSFFVVSTIDFGFLDGNDLAQYILHTSPDTTLGTIIERFATDTIPVDAIPAFDSVFFVSYVIGNNKNNNVDITDECLAVSAGQAVIIYQSPFVDAGPYQNICGSTSLLSGVSALTAMWSQIAGPAPAVFDATDVTSAISLPEPGTYILALSSNNNICSDTDTDTVQLITTAELTVTTLTVCDGTTFTGTATITGGSGSYLIDDQSLSGNIYTSNNNLSGDTIIITISDSLGICSPVEILLTRNCDCDTAPPTWASTGETLCPDDTLDVTLFSNLDAVLDSNDILIYSIRDLAGNILDQNTTGIFLFNQLTYVFGIRYDVFVTVGTELPDGSIDLEEPCTALSLPLPIAWNGNTEVFIQGTSTICLGDSVTIEVTAIDHLPATILISDSEGNQYPVAISTNSTLLTVAPIQSTVLSIIDGTADCTLTFGGTYEITVELPEEYQLTEDLIICDNSLFGSVVLFDQLLFEPLAGIWTSTGGIVGTAGIDFADVPAGVYEITFQPEQTAVCPRDSVSTLITVEECNCPIITQVENYDVCNSVDNIALDQLLQSELEGTWTVEPSNSSNPIEIIGTDLITNGKSGGTYTVVYTITVPLPDDCIIDYPITIDVEEDTPPAVQSSFPVICQESVAAIDLDALLSDTGGYEYYSADFQTPLTSPLTVTGATEPLLIQAISTDQELCPADTTLLSIATSPIPLYDIEPTDANCFGADDGSVTIALQVGEGVLTSLNSSELSDIFLYSGLQPGTYDLYLETTDGCNSSTTFTIAEPAPVSVSLGNDTTLLVNETLDIEAIVNILESDIQSITWQALTEILSNDDLILSRNFQNQEYITIRIVDENGCEAEDDILVSVLSTEVVIPNIFSPRGTGDNSSFGIKNTSEVPTINEMSIYDRWGNRVYGVANVETASADAQWDGTYNGTPVVSGMYVYYISAIDRSGRTVSFVGDLTVME